MTKDEAHDLFPDAPKTLFEKLAEIGLEIGYVQKDKKNIGQDYKYASAEAVLGKANLACFSRGIAIQSNAYVEHYSQYEDPQTHKVKMRAVVKLSLTFIDGGQGNRAVQIEGLGEGMDAGDKAILKANTSALKYALANAFLISWGEDPEADATTDRDVGATKQPARAKATAPDLDDLIANATVESMAEVRKAVMAARDSAKYQSYVAAIKAKQTELGWTPN